VNREVVFSAEAKRDLQEILAYVAEDSPRLALDLIERLNIAALDLGATGLQFPIAFTGSEIRRRVTGSYNIYYLVRERSISISRILHGARNQQRQLFFDD
jgi:plasmid stabilization system protein ParE